MQAVMQPPIVKTNSTSTPLNVAKPKLTARVTHERKALRRFLHNLMIALAAPVA